MTPNHVDKLVLVAGGCSQAGRQQAVNEDHLAMPESVDPELLDRLGHLYVVADGMGGHTAGEQASALAVSTVMRAYYGNPSIDPGQGLIEAIRQANAVVYRQAQFPETAGMGSTVVAALIRGHDLYVAHVGDSRAYLIRGQMIKQITEDHSWVAEQVRDGLLTGEEARRHTHRHVLTRALGSEPEVGIDLSREELSPGDIVLLCSDGLTDEVRDEEIRQIVAGHDPQKAATRLVELADQRGGTDDVTALVVGVMPEPQLAPVARPKPSRLAPILGGVAIAAVILIALYWALALRGPMLPAAVPSPFPTAVVAVVSTHTPIPSVPAATSTVAPSPSAPTPTATPTPQPSPPTVTPSPPTVEELAQSLHAPWKAEEWEKVIRIVQQILAINPDYDGMTEKLYSARFNYGRQLAAEGKLKEAKLEFTHALEVKPDGGEAIWELQALAASETPAPSATLTPELPQGYIHVVQQGEWLCKIARMYGTTAQAIMAANGLTSNTIYPGQRLLIPAQ